MTNPFNSVFEEFHKERADARNAVGNFNAWYEAELPGIKALFEDAVEAAKQNGWSATATIEEIEPGYRQVALSMWRASDYREVFTFRIGRHPEELSVLIDVKLGHTNGVNPKVSPQPTEPELVTLVMWFLGQVIRQEPRA